MSIDDLCKKKKKTKQTNNELNVIIVFYFMANIKLLVPSQDHLQPFKSSRTVLIRV